MTYFNSLRMNTLGRGVQIALAAGALVLASARALAASPDPLDPVQLNEITVTAPAIGKTVGRDAATGASINIVTATARVAVDPVALRTEYGALMLHYSVRAAAQKVCTQLDPFGQDDVGSCYRKALQSGESQANTAIAQARSAPEG